MKTIIIENKGFARSDDLLTATLELIPATPDALEKEHIRIAVRNEFDLIYREIGVTSLLDFMALLNGFEELGFINEVETSQAPANRYDAIFSPGPVH